MKNYLAGLLLILVIISCTTKKENETQVVSNDYISKPIGISDKGQYNITASDTLMKNLESRLKESFSLSDSTSLSEFEIIKTATEGDAPKDCYLLVTRTSVNPSTLALILDSKDDKFYFSTFTRNKTLVSQVIMCKGDAGTGCGPTVLSLDKQKKLICLADSDCEKVISEVAW
jgi:putative salt-induced outer membrane protein YdiY